jgi:DNA-binding XRE family transcriptional regulator
MTVQIVEIGGQKIAMLPADEFERLVEQYEERMDIAAAERAEQRRLSGEEEFIPFGMVKSVIDGENALRAWRKHRGLTQDQLATRANVRLSTVSEIETGKAQGKPSIWRAFAKVLNVTVDDIFPHE